MVGVLGAFPLHFANHAWRCFFAVYLQLWHQIDQDTNLQGMNYQEGDLQ